MKSIFNIEKFLLKPTEPIVPKEEDGNRCYYVVSHIPMPCTFKWIKEHNIPNERIKAIVDIDKWYSFQKLYIEHSKDIADRAFNESLLWAERMTDYQKTIEKQQAKINELEYQISEISKILTSPIKGTQYINNQDEIESNAESETQK